MIKDSIINVFDAIDFFWTSKTAGSACKSLAND
jgi:hypothetical protein